MIFLHFPTVPEGFMLGFLGGFILAISLIVIGKYIYSEFYQVRNFLSWLKELKLK